MEIYVKLKDVEELLNKLYDEPGYQHTGETFYAGICAVKSDLDTLSTLEYEPRTKATWRLMDRGMFGADYQCSHCGCWAPESNSGHYDKLTNFCPVCGAIVVGGNNGSK